MNIFYAEPNAVKLATHEALQPVGRIFNALAYNLYVKKLFISDRIQEQRQLYSELKGQRSNNIAGRLRKLFNRVSNNNASGFKLEQLDNGLIRASNGYYALTQDKETQAINILWSREQEFLLGEKDENGTNHLSSSENVYFVDSLPVEYSQPVGANSKKAIFDCTKVRAIISNDFIRFRESVQNISLHGGDVSDLYGSLRYIEPNRAHNGKQFRSTVQSFGNDQVSYSISDTSDGRWILKKYAPYSRLNAAETYVEISGSNVEEDRLLKNIFSNGFEKGVFSSQAEAFFALIKIWNEDAQKYWRGEKIVTLEEAPYTVFRTALYDATIKEILNKENIEEGAFDSILQTGAVVKGAMLGAKLISMPAIFALTITAGFATRKGLSAFKWGIKEADWRLRGVKSTNPDLADYIAPDRQNQNRIRKKLHQDFISKNRLLGIEDLPINGITDDFEPTISASDKNWIDRWLVTFNNKGFPTFDIIADDYSEINICLNGLVRYESRDPLTRDKVVYSTYLKDFDLNPHIKLPEEIREVLSENGIVKVQQIEAQQTFVRTPVTTDNFYDEISKLLENQSCGAQQRTLTENATECLCQIFHEQNIRNNDGQFILPNLAKLIPPEAIEPLPKVA